MLNAGLYQKHGRMAGYDWTIGEMDNVQPWQLFCVCADADAGGCELCLIASFWSWQAESGEKKKTDRKIGQQCGISNFQGGSGQARLFPGCTKAPRPLNGRPASDPRLSSLVSLPPLSYYSVELPTSQLLF